MRHPLPVVLAALACAILAAASSVPAPSIPVVVVLDTSLPPLPSENDPCDTPDCASCQGLAIGQGWCPNKTCTQDDCSANWKSVDNATCQATCIPDSNLCCGWRINTSQDCKCVDDPEPSGTCAVCGKAYENPW